MSILFRIILFCTKIPHVIKLFQVSFLSGTSNLYLFFSLSTNTELTISGYQVTKPGSHFTLQ